MTETMSTSKSDFASNVAKHYNSVENKSISERNKSEIIALRKFNNAMKSLMHHQAFKFANHIPNEDHEPFRVLDLGCGKGGDLPKYDRNRRVGLVVGVDVADVSIEQCKARFETFKDRPGSTFDGKFFVADLTTTDIESKLKEIKCTEKFHIASCQFSLHYSFESYEKAVRYLSNASKNLMKHGIFFGTYPDGPKLLKLARQSGGTYQVDELMTVQFNTHDLNNPQPFGTKYHFKLKEVVDCPEFLVHPEVLERLLKRLGFFKVFDRSFEENLKESIANPSDGLQAKKIFNYHSAFEFDEHQAYLDEDTWKAVSVYRCFCYKKLRDD